MSAPRPRPPASPAPPVTPHRQGSSGVLTGFWEGRKRAGCALYLPATARKQGLRSEKQRGVGAGERRKGDGWNERKKEKERRIQTSMVSSRSGLPSPPCSRPVRTEQRRQQRHLRGVEAGGGGREAEREGVGSGSAAQGRACTAAGGAGLAEHCAPAADGAEHTAPPTRELQPPTVVAASTGGGPRRLSNEGLVQDRVRRPNEGRCLAATEKATG